jgi:hypothetical protein
MAGQRQQMLAQQGGKLRGRGSAAFKRAGKPRRAGAVAAFLMALLCACSGPAPALAQRPTDQICLTARVSFRRGKTGGLGARMDVVEQRGGVRILVTLPPHALTQHNTTQHNTTQHTIRRCRGRRRGAATATRRRSRTALRR